jgi:hypothetical protein
MYRVLDESEEAGIGIKVESPLTEQDYDVLLPYLKQHVEAVGSVNLLFDLTPLRDEQSMSHCWDAVFSRLRMLGNVPRVAVVGRRGTLDSSGEAVRSPSSTSVHWFSPDQMHEAWIWLKNRG